MSTERKTHLDPLAVGVLLTCCAIWGVAQVAAKLTLAEVPPLLQSGLRSAGAALCLLLWSLAALRAPPQRPRVFAGVTVTDSFLLAV